SGHATCHVAAGRGTPLLHSGVGRIGRTVAERRGIQQAARLAARSVRADLRHRLLPLHRLHLLALHRRHAWIRARALIAAERAVVAPRWLELHLTTPRIRTEQWLKLIGEQA